MSVKVHSAQVVGLYGKIIDVEIDVMQGLHHFSVVGLPDKAVEESTDRLSAAIKNLGFISPQKKNQRITVSLAPADLKKEGPVFDLSIALAYLLISKQIKFSPKNKLFLGELGLDGALRPIKGVLSLARAAKENGFTEIYLPEQNAEEAALIRELKVYGSGNLKDIVLHLQGEKLLTAQRETEARIDRKYLENMADFSDVKGQETAKRGLEIAAAGGHNVLMVGPPGTGKTMLAKAMASILPALSFEEILETTAIHSVSGALEGSYLNARPIRTPHHTASYVALVGGGTWPKPGEISLSHRGVLFLDEFPLFEKRLIEALRQPLEDGVITVSRVRGSLKFPARFILVCAMNPCPCGNLDSKTKQCICSQGDILRYKRKISGPIADRIDLWLEVSQVETEKLSKDDLKAEPSFKIRERVSEARKIQEKRFKNREILTNSEMGVRELKKFSPLSEPAQQVLTAAAKRLDLSARAYHRIIKLGRTIADLDKKENIEENHIFEAIQYRPKTSY